jgi:hypothetical protein
VATGDQHEYRESLQPEALFAFLERFPEHGPEYVLATVEMLKRRFPDQVGDMLPRLRDIYRKKRLLSKK